ncbi:MAG: PAS domain-containing sensor histidine kinase [Saprospiraceae bacterium]|jgi:PAS domain S-box-containing protein|nr:PAS domain-containing sensor histidine kinase [Saprospiraceae bacterium]
MERGRESEIKLKAIFDAAVDGIITINQSGMIEEVNRAACKLFGYSKEEIVGKNVNILMPFHHSRHHDQYMERYQHTKEARIIGIGREVEGKKKDGEYFPFWLAVIEIDLEDRKIYTGFIHDLSEIKDAENQLRAMNEVLENKVIARTNELEGAVNQLLSLNKKLEAEITDKIKAQNLLQIREIELEKSLAKERELGELKSRFVSMASHEFRTPLATILSSVSLIGRYSDKDQQQQREKHITKIKSSVTHLTGILNDFLSLNKLEEGKINTTQEIFNPMALCEEVLDELKPIYKPYQIISIEKGIDKDIRIENVKTDRKILKNIMINLISNAIKYTHDDGVIVCSLEVFSDAVIFKVKDNGIGIPDEDQKHLCDRFFRASNAVNIEGTGLGLNIVKKYTEILEGMITFESKMYSGSTFTVKIKNNYQKPIESNVSG